MLAVVFFAKISSMKRRPKYEIEQVSELTRRSVLAGYTMRALRCKSLMQDNARIDQRVTRFVDRANRPDSLYERYTKECITGFQVLRTLATCAQNGSVFPDIQPKVRDCAQLYVLANAVIGYSGLTFNKSALNLPVTLEAYTVPELVNPPQSNLHKLMYRLWNERGGRKLLPTSLDESPVFVPYYETPLKIHIGGSARLHNLLADMYVLNDAMGYQWPKDARVEPFQPS